MIVDDHVCSLTREPYRDGAADAVLAPSARHQRDFAT
jgi:hypothetical protein